MSINEKIKKIITPKEETNWDSFCNPYSVKNMSDEQLKHVLSCVSEDSLKILFRDVVDYNITGDFLMLSQKFCIPSSNTFRVISIISEEIKKRLLSNSKKSFIGFKSIEDFSFYMDSVFSYMIREHVENSDKFVNMLKERIYFRKYESYMFIKDKQYFVEKFKSVKRSSGYMEKRFLYAYNIVQTGCMDHDDVRMIFSGLSKTLKEKMLSELIGILETLNKACFPDHFNGYPVNTIYSIDEMKSIRRNMIILFINCIKKDIYSYHMERYMANFVKEDVPFIMPLIASIGFNSGAKSASMRCLKNLL